MMRQTVVQNLGLALIVMLSSVLHADDITKLDVYPPAIKLGSQRSSSQLIVTGVDAQGSTRDLTPDATITSEPAGIVTIEQGRVLPKADGAATITIRAGQHSQQVAVEVTKVEQPDPVRFQSEILAVLTKQGCNAGSCHGAPEGKGGLALSMLAYKPSIDEESLLFGGLSRRVEPIEPAESLLIKKPLLRVTHVGGKKLHPHDAAYRLLMSWIGEGARPEAPTVAKATSIVVHPGPSRVLREPHLRQQISVQARFSDGTLRDVTPIATYDSSNKEVAVVDANGLITGKSRGLTAITVRYLSFMQSVYCTVIQNVDGFAWQASPEFNPIDRHVNQKLRQLQFLPSGLCDDGTFLRRLSLDLTGLLPTAEMAKEFLADTRADKRARLIDTLLTSDEFARHWAQKEADLLRVNPTLLDVELQKTAPQKVIEGRAALFNRWLIDSFRNNQPYDEYARQLLTASGDTREVPPTNYFQAIPSNEDLTETTAQLFMGSRINCAKCHNHPFENWTQDDYYRIAAVFTRVKKDKEQVVEMDKGETQHPATGQVMKPWGSDDVPAAELAKSDRRTGFARWLTQRGNPFFARVEVNRLWAHLLGRGIVHPVDDFRSSNPPANPELLDYLAAEFESHDFDRRHILRLICNSHTYQRTSATNPFNERDTTLFSHAIPRRLSGEQLRDALGYASRTLLSIRELAPDLVRQREEMAKRRATIIEGQAAWEADQHQRLQKAAVWGGVWSVVGPFKAVAPQNWEHLHAQIFAPERGVDLTKEVDAREITIDGEPVNSKQPAKPLKWASQPEWFDGQIQMPPSADNGLCYFTRQLHVREAGKATLELALQDAYKIWIDGKLVKTANKRRNFENSTEKVVLDLKAGEHTLLIKGSHASGTLRFRESLTEWNGKGIERFPLSGEAIEALASSGKPLSGPVRERVVAHRLATDQPLLNLQAGVLEREQRMQYHTQRPFPERSPFTEAFGQPKRESPCACDRSSDPTIDQALVLLNGQLVQNAVAAGSNVYQQFDNGELVEALYLSAFARRPTPREQEQAVAYLSRTMQRPQAIQDLLWVIFNTQEFLFQH